jgi:hypothetical protein
MLNGHCRRSRRETPLLYSSRRICVFRGKISFVQSITEGKLGFVQALLLRAHQSRAWAVRAL